jgi:hypothetical protein
MKKVLVVLAVVIGLALVFSSGYAQKWDSADEAKAIAKGKEFKFTGIEIVSVDPKAQTVMFKSVKGDKTAIARLGYAKYEGGYSGVADLKAGDKVSGEGVVVNGVNWIQKIRIAEAGAKPSAGPKKD